jgi:hypothetical protein
MFGYANLSDTKYANLESDFLAIRVKKDCKEKILFLYIIVVILKQVMETELIGLRF